MPAISLRRFRFSLRTLFVVMTFLGIALGWLGWELHFVRERKREATRLEALGYVVVTTTRNYSGQQPAVRAARNWLNRRIPWWRRLLGDEHYTLIGVEKDDEVRRRVEQLFPESQSTHFRRDKHQAAVLFVKREDFLGGMIWIPM